MFNLDHAIADWRRIMAAAGIQSPDVLDELESHLREDIERRVKAGADAAEVFRIAAAQIGQPHMLQAEFARSQNKERQYMKRKLMIGAGIIGILIGMAFVMPAVAQYRHEGVMKNEEPWLFLLGGMLTLAGCAAAIGNLRKRRA
jgi:hypothetical protein